MVVLSENSDSWPDIGCSDLAVNAVNNGVLRISVKVISGFGERDQGRKVVLRGQEIVA